MLYLEIPLQVLVQLQNGGNIATPAGSKVSGMLYLEIPGLFSFHLRWTPGWRQRCQTCRQQGFGYGDSDKVSKGEMSRNCS